MNKLMLLPTPKSPLMHYDITGMRGNVHECIKGMISE